MMSSQKQLANYILNWPAEMEAKPAWWTSAWPPQLVDEESGVQTIQIYLLLLQTMGQAASNYVTSPGTFTAHILAGSKMAGQYGHAGYTSVCHSASTWHHRECGIAW